MNNLCVCNPLCFYGEIVTESYFIQTFSVFKRPLKKQNFDMRDLTDNRFIVCCHCIIHIVLIVLYIM